MEHLIQENASRLTTQQLYSQLIQRHSKNLRLAMLLALLLGGLGAHKFYQERITEGVVYLLFSWTLIPTLFALIDVFFLPGQIRVSNHAAELKALMAASPADAQAVQNLLEQQATNHHLEIVLKIIFGILFAWLVYVSGASLFDKAKLHQLQQQIHQFAL